MYDLINLPDVVDGIALNEALIKSSKADVAYFLSWAYLENGKRATDDDFDEPTNVELEMIKKIYSWGLINSDTYNQLMNQTLVVRKAVPRPAAKETACCSAIPTSKNLFGNSFENFSNPVPSVIAAVIATTLLSFLAIFVIASPNALE